MKNIIVNRLRLSGLILLLLMGYALGASAAPLNYEDFGRLPDVANLNLSPDGKKLASIIRVDMPSVKGSAVQVTQLSDGTSKMVLFSDNSKYFINGLQWKDSKTLLVNTFFPSERDTWVGMGQARFKTREGRLLIVDTEAGTVTSPFSKTFLKKFRVFPSNLNSVVDTLPQDPEHILMAIPSLDNGFPSYPIVYKVNIKTSKNKRIQPSKPYVSEWMTDQQQRVRIGIYFKDGEIRTLVREVNADKWRELWPYQLFSEDEVTPVGFGLDPNVLYIRAYQKGFLALFKVNLTDTKLKRELVYTNPYYDVTGGLVYSPETKDVVGFSYGENGGTTFFDPSLQKLQEGINKALPKTKNFIYSFTNDFEKYLVLTLSDIDSGSYFLGQRSPAKLEAAGYRYKNLLPESLVPIKRYDYAARDGLNIEAYLSLPKGIAPKKLPAIMFPHGGPIGHDDDNFDAWAQYFASKGYAVLQMNFRGSAGQGVEFRNAGFKSWGKEMQDDIEDGAKKLIADGIIDPHQICIVGASYGGYAALMGIVKTPDVYKCAISVAGVSNVFDLVKDNRAFWRSYNVVDEQIGNDNKELRAASPVNFADKIKVPVLLVHGDMDRQVDIKHSVQMHDALQKAGKDVTFVTLPNEDHYLTNEANRLTTFKVIGTFLDKNLPVKAKP